MLVCYIDVEIITGPLVVGVGSAEVMPQISLLTGIIWNTYKCGFRFHCHVAFLISIICIYVL